MRDPKNQHDLEPTLEKSAKIAVDQTPDNDDDDNDDKTTLGSLIENEHDLIQKELKQYRNAAIKLLPSVMVNNSSNAIAMTQLVAEMMMFKANNMDLVNKEHRTPGTWWRYLTDPPANIWKSVSQSAGLSFSVGDLLKPKFYKDTVKGFINLDHASDIDKGSNLAAPNKLINRWQARSTFTGLMTMAITALVPDSKDDPEVVQQNAILLQKNPIAYVGKRFGEAFMFPVTVVAVTARKIVTLGKYETEHGVGAHKRQFTGLGLLVTGIFSFLSGFRNVGMINPSLGKENLGNLKYARNTAHSIGGLITAGAALQLILALDNDEGWSRYGATQWLRMIFLPKSISNRYENNDPKANWYVAGQVGLQSSNTMSYFIGGAEKHADGTVIDHTAMRDRARDVARKAKIASKSGKNKAHAANDDAPIVANDDEMPSNKVSAVQKSEFAMPERRASQQEHA